MFEGKIKLPLGEMLYNEESGVLQLPERPGPQVGWILRALPLFPTDVHKEELELSEFPSYFGIPAIWNVPKLGSTEQSLAKLNFIGFPLLHRTWKHTLEFTADVNDLR